MYDVLKSLSVCERGRERAREREMDADVDADKGIDI